MNETFTPVDTTDMQLQSVIGFMRGLGFDYFPGDSKLARRFYYIKGKTDKSIVSFRTAVRLHNSNWYVSREKPMLVVPEEFNKMSNTAAKWVFTLPEVRSAIGAKLVQRVRLQLNKRTNTVALDTHLVKLEDAAYYDILKFFANIQGVTLED